MLILHKILNHSASSGLNRPVASVQVNLKPELQTGSHKFQFVLSTYFGGDLFPRITSSQARHKFFGSQIE